MKIVSNTVYKFFPQRSTGIVGESKKAFAIIPKEMIAENEKFEFDRAVAFGAVADRINALVTAGLKLIEVAEGRFRKDESFGTTELVCVSLPDGTTDTMPAPGQKAAVPLTPDEVKFIEDYEFRGEDEIPF